ncbi:YigZ family protein [Halolactibacillus alkaliphilus]|uniref:YigZ family protein n=1 Tax=Halolactibacillus alkaliphilus TaxID=442899 RepID=A0A511X2C0_9BACI|nr:YigZ family protein [Halolactibacillus alkaliphilus]GEN57079.1 YigZ family protein [Halolactibacillus alkaliphilus]GGN71831.1 YigZ family protein [Halolactibacillus alkaliphilus]SFO87100.1 uncharacterized protein, YigZ family [Halolactibacillus alkaliphilus]
MLKKYYTINPYGEEEIEIQKSRFIGHAKRCETEEEAKAFIQDIKKTHAQATHNCSAYLIGEHDQIQKALDDGEPSGTAGVPILEVIKKRGLKDTCIVVTRYFGGVKLGAGGLIRAYSSSAKSAIDQAGIVERRLIQKLAVTASYPLLGKLENELRQTDYIVESIDYLDQVTIHLAVIVDDVETCKNWLINLSSDQVTITEKETAYIEVPVA